VSTDNLKNSLKIDLHSHTVFSDGRLTPTELVMRAHNMQVDVLAITDHDTIAGLQEAHNAQLQYKRDMKIINGVELSTAWHGFDIHIVGLNIDVTSPDLLAGLESQRHVRDVRAEMIATKLEKCGFLGILDKAKKIASPGQITRAHFARVMVESYSVANAETAFRKYLGKGKRAAVKADWPVMEKAIEWIHKAGGQAILAHPIHYDMTTKWLRRLVENFSDAQGDAMEMAFPGLGPDKASLLEEMALQYNLLASAGSDFHFPGRWTELGRCAALNGNLTPIWHDWSLPAQQVSN
jgi:predicted metal-dependent phosphoesterase TrpH